MKIFVTLSAYQRLAENFPALSGHSGKVYGKGVWNSKKRRHDIRMALDEWQKIERDVYNNLRRAGAQWTVSDVSIEAEGDELLETQAKLEAAQSDLAAMTAERDEALSLLAKMPAGTPVVEHNVQDAELPADPPAEPPAEPSTETVTEPPAEPVSQLPRDTRRAELEPKGFRELRSIAKDERHDLTLPNNVQKTTLIDLIIDSEFPPAA